MLTRHVFVCSTGETCEAQGGAEVRNALKKLVVDAGLKHQIRINHCGCLGQCGLGPNIVIYPEGVWYMGVSLEDVPDIFHSLISGTSVERLINLDCMPSPAEPQP